jgi:putative ABC transport system permease protein
MTVDGTFPLGAATSAVLISLGVNPWLSLVFSCAAGATMGLITGFVSTHMRVYNLLAGILSMTALYSINLRIMGKPNISLLGEASIFGREPLITLMIFAVLAALLVLWFFNTELGLAMRASGTNARMSNAQGIRVDHMIWLGLACSNALVALSGGLFAQHLGFADINMGLGTIVIGLAAVIIGEAFIRPRRVFSHVCACLIGALLFRTAIAIALNIKGIGLLASDLNLITAVLVGLATLFPKWQSRRA